MKQNKNKALAPQSYEEKIAEAENLRLEAIAHLYALTLSINMFSVCYELLAICD